MTDTTCSPESWSTTYHPLSCTQLTLTNLDRLWQWFKRKLFWLATWLDKNRFIYALYGFNDGLSLTYSTIKNIFDLLYTNTPIPSLDSMQDWLNTPWGMIAALTTTLSFVGLAIIYNYVQEDAIKNKVMLALLELTKFYWPYFRNICKTFKMGFKSTANIYYIVHVFSHVTYLHYLFLVAPVGLILGVLSGINKCLLSYLIDLRKVMMKSNIKLLQNALTKDKDDAQKIANIRRLVQSQPWVLRICSYLLSLMGGVYDSLYVYTGALGITLLAPPLFITMISICATYALLCVISRVYEEYNYQKNLTIAKNNVHLVLCVLELNNLRATPDGDQKENDLNTKKRELARLLFATQELLSTSYTSALFVGIRDGLAVYSAASMILMLVSTFLILTSTAAFPYLLPFLVATVVPLGLVFIAYYIKRSLVATYCHRKNNKSEQFWVDAIQSLEAKPLDALLAITSISPTETSEAGALFETMRQGLCGGYKGVKAFDFVAKMAPINETDGHFNSESTAFIIFSFISSIFYAIVLFLREFADQYKENAGYNPSIVTTKRRTQDDAPAAAKAPYFDDKETPKPSTPPKNRRTTSCFGCFGLWKPPRDQELTRNAPILTSAH